MFCTMKSKYKLLINVWLWALNNISNNKIDNKIIKK